MSVRRVVRTGVFLGLLIVGLTLSSSLSFAKVAPKEGMTQGEFAVFLVEVLDAQGFLPEAAVVNDDIVFLEGLGIEPPGGWEADKVLTRDDLVYMLGLKKAGKLTFAELLDMLKARLEELLWARTGFRQSISPVSP